LWSLWFTYFSSCLRGKKTHRHREMLDKKDSSCRIDPFFDDDHKKSLPTPNQEALNFCPGECFPQTSGPQLCTTQYEYQSQYSYDSFRPPVLSRVFCILTEIF
jgi:hypothetical protein